MKLIFPHSTLQLETTEPILERTDPHQRAQFIILHRLNEIDAGPVAMNMAFYLYHIETEAHSAWINHMDQFTRLIGVPGWNSRNPWYGRRNNSAHATFDQTERLGNLLMGYMHFNDLYHIAWKAWHTLENLIGELNAPVPTDFVVARNAGQIEDKRAYAEELAAQITTSNEALFKLLYED